MRHRITSFRLFKKYELLHCFYSAVRRFECESNAATEQDLKYFNLLSLFGVLTGALVALVAKL